MLGRQRQNWPTHPYAPISAASQTVQPQKLHRKKCSKQWMQHLQSEILGSSGRLRAYVHWHLNSETLGRYPYRPAPSLTHQNANYQLEMLSELDQLHTVPSALPTWPSWPGTIPRQVVPTVPTQAVRWTHTRRRRTHNQPMSSVTGSAPRPKVLEQISRSNASDWHTTLQTTRPRREDLGGPRKPPPPPNAQKFPHLETASHTYVRRVCPRLANAPETIATHNPTTFLGRQRSTRIRWWRIL